MPSAIKVYMNILSIPIEEPERLFPNDLGEAQAKWRDLIRTWHPDRCPDSNAAAVTQRVNELYEAVMVKIAKGTWSLPNQVRFAYGDKTIEFNFLRKHLVGEATVYVGHKAMLYNYRDLPWWDTFTFASSTMQDEMGKYLPDIKYGPIVLNDGSSLLVLKKTEDQYLLKDLIARIDDPRQIAWIISSILNINCFLQYNGLCHNAITENALLCSPEHHSVALAGDWFFACKHGQKLSALPTDIYRRYATLVHGKIATQRIDRFQVRHLCGMLLDKVPIEIVPTPMREWANDIPRDGAIDEYKHWTTKVLIDSFGPRKFTPWNILRKDVYG